MTLQSKVRNKGIARVKLSEIEDAPWNFRQHPQAQKAALDGLVDELGFYGYPDVYETEGGQLRLIDGHLRKELLIAKYGADAEIEVNVTDFGEEEAKKATLTKDPLAAMAATDGKILDDLLKEVSTQNEGVQKMLDELGKQAAVPIVDTQPQLAVELQFKVVVDCDDEQQQTALLRELELRGLHCKAMML